PARILFMSKPVLQLLDGLLLLILIGMCGSMVYYIKTGPSLTSPTTLPASPSQSGTLKAMSDTGWTLVGPGLDRRVIRLGDDQSQLLESVHIWRLDQNYFRMDVAYDETPKSLENWQQQTQAEIVLNGGYFSIENEKYFPDGLTIVDGEPLGSTFNG